MSGTLTLTKFNENGGTLVQCSWFHEVEVSYKFYCCLLDLCRLHKLKFHLSQHENLPSQQYCTCIALGYYMFRMDHCWGPLVTCNGKEILTLPGLKISKL